MEDNKIYKRRELNVIYEDDLSERKKETKKNLLKSSKTSFSEIYGILKKDESEDFFYLRSLTELEFDLFKGRAENSNDFKKALLSPVIAMAVLLNTVIGLVGIQYAQLIKEGFPDLPLGILEIKLVIILIFMILGIIVILIYLVSYRHSSDILLLTKNFTTIKEYEKKNK